MNCLKIFGKSKPAQESKSSKVEWKKVSAVGLFILGLIALTVGSIFASGLYGAGVMYTIAGSLLLFSILHFSGSACIIFHDDSA